MVKASRPVVKTLTLVKSRDIVVDRLLKPCEEDNHSKCTGWAVLRKEVLPIDANYFLRCTCTCHHKKEPQQIKKQIRKKQLKKRIKKKAKKRKLRKISKKSKRSKKARRR